MNVENNGISATNTSKFTVPREEGVTPWCTVITYSVSKTLEATINTLQSRGASLHYIIDQDGKQFQYHNDFKSQAFYAGNSSWKGHSKVNKFGIGIMLVNDSESNFPEVQINKLNELLKNIQDRYPDIDMKNDLIGLGEVAERHIAPGKYFPWQELAKHGFGQFIDTTAEQRSEIIIRKGNTGDTVTQNQSQLKNHGYGVEVTGTCDDKTITWYKKFNERYVPEQSPPDVWTKASQFVLDTLHDNDIIVVGHNVESEPHAA